MSNIEWPPLPDHLEAPLGRITVDIVPELTPQEAGTDAMGRFMAAKRRIEIDGRWPIEVQWATFFHEQMHVYLTDTGTHIGIKDDVEERICEAAALGRFHEMREHLRR